MYAKTFEDAMSYINTNYGIQEGARRATKFFDQADNYYAERGCAMCACGESDAVRVFNTAGEEVAEIIICESCYDNVASIHERI